jgi:hypothetical protein
MNTFFLNLLSGSKKGRRESTRNSWLPNGKFEGTLESPGFLRVKKNGVDRIYFSRHGDKSYIYFYAGCGLNIMIKYDNLFMIKLVTKYFIFKLRDRFFSPLNTFRSEFSFIKLTFLRRKNYIERCFCSNLMDAYFS